MSEAAVLLRDDHLPPELRPIGADNERLAAALRYAALPHLLSRLSRPAIALRIWQRRRSNISRLDAVSSGSFILVCESWRSTRLPEAAKSVHPSCYARKHCSTASPCH